MGGAWEIAMVVVVQPGFATTSAVLLCTTSLPTAAATTRLDQQPTLQRPCHALAARRHRKGGKGAANEKNVCEAVKTSLDMMRFIVFIGWPIYATLAGSVPNAERG